MDEWLQYKILSSSQLLKRGVGIILLDELAHSAKIKSCLFLLSKEAAVAYRVQMIEKIIIEADLYEDLHEELLKKIDIVGIVKESINNQMRAFFYTG